MPTDFSFQSRDEKKTYVERMFGQIAKRYDFFNHFLSLGFDYAWRKRAIEVLRGSLQEKTSPLILDIACGTGDLAFEALKQMPQARLIGLDLTQPMLDIFAKKAHDRHLSVQLEKGDVEQLKQADNSIDGVTIGFGTRNFTNLEIAFREIHRVLKPGGVFVNLELAKPRVFPMKQLYNLYFNGILPLVGTIFSGHNSAYKYLPDSLRKFPDLEALAEIMKKVGFRQVTWETRTTGIVAIHSAIK
jgi:demethylmenaquinone methyltransferase/2-methoxy-6-polyprenyl-1,4-benzoquinol methylase